MKILMDRRGEFLYSASGMGTYSAMLWRGLRQAVRGRAEKFRLAGYGESDKRLTKDFFWEEIIAQPLTCVPKVMELSPELVFLPNNGLGGGSLHHLPCPAVVTVHDMIPFIMPEAVGGGYLQIFREQMPEILRRAAHIIAVSHQTKNDIVRLGGAPPEKITVIYEGANEIFQPLPKAYVHNMSARIWGLEPPYLLYVGGFSGRKNVRSLLLAFARLTDGAGSCGKSRRNLRLVLVGRDSPNRRHLQELAQALGIGGRCLWLENVAPYDLPLLYNGSEMLVYPSLYEGFGLPPLEAMACGVPVVVGDNSSLPEVVGKAGLTVNAADVAQLAFAAKMLLESPETAAELGKAGVRRAAKFSWRQNAEKTLKIFEKVGKPADKI